MEIKTSVIINAIHTFNYLVFALNTKVGDGVLQYMEGTTDPLSDKIHRFIVNSSKTKACIAIISLIIEISLLWIVLPAKLSF